MLALALGADSETLGRTEAKDVAVDTGTDAVAGDSMEPMTGWLVRKGERRWRCNVGMACIRTESPWWNEGMQGR